MSPAALMPPPAIAEPKHYWLLGRRVRAELTFERRDDAAVDHYVMTLGTKARPEWARAYVAETPDGWFMRQMPLVPVPVSLPALNLLKRLPRRKGMS